MSTGGAEVSKTSSRAAALAQLKFKRKKDVQSVQPEPVQSRFFGAVEPATPRVPRVLVPDSSPSAPHNQPSATTTKLPTGAWTTSRGLRDDTLSVPSFAPSTSSTTVTPVSKYPNGRDNNKSSSSNTSVIDLDPDDGPPRKKPRPDLERIRSTRSDASSSAASVPPSSRVSPTPTPSICVADDPLSPVVGKLRKEVSRVTVAATSAPATSSDSDDGGGVRSRRRVVRGRRKIDPVVDEEELPSPRSLVKKVGGGTLESDNDEREGIIHIRSSPPPAPPLSGKLVNGKRVDAITGKNGKAPTPSASSKSTPNMGTKPLPEKSKPPPEKVKPAKADDQDGGASSGTEFDASDDGEGVGEWVVDEATQRLEGEALEWFNEASEEALVEVTACTQSQAKIITSLRPFADIPSLKRALKRTKGVTQRFYDEYLNMQRGYSDVDSVLGEFEAIGRELAAIVSEWGADATGMNGGEDGGLHLVT
ncbi:hypothetical protein FRC07_013897, partial [Ceratobasidium sp. 392]